MNALVGIRANSAGFLSATRAKRQDAAREIQSNAQAAQQSMLLKMFGPKAASASSSAGSGAVLPNQTLDKDSFLRLLVQQMQSQDPLNPADSTQMVSQLAQFSSLEQMNNLNASFTTLSGNIDQLNFISASSMVGRHVTGLDVDKKPVDGTVTNIRMSGSLVYLTIGEQTMSMAGVATVG